MSATAAKKHPGVMGRPSKYSQALVDEICAQLSEGKSLRRVCSADDMPALRTVIVWLREKPDFVRQYARAKQDGADALADDIQDMGDDVLEGKYDPHAARVALDAKKWIASKLKPKKYGDRTEVDFNPVNPVTFISEVPAPKSNQEDPLPNETDPTDPQEATD